MHKLKDNLKTDKLYEKVHYLDPSYLNISDRALVYTNSMVELAMASQQNKAYLEYFEVVKEPMYQTILALYFPSGSVYFDRFNSLSLRLISGGFLIKWFKATHQYIVERHAASSTPSAPVGVDLSHQADGDDRTPLTYDDLRMAFYILYIGLTVSTLCFLKEVFKFKTISS